MRLINRFITTKPAAALAAAMLIPIFYGAVLAQEGTRGNLEKGVTVKLEQCLNLACDRTDIIESNDGLELETTLWDKEKKQGIVVVKNRYRAPNRIDFGDLYFDHVAFSPTRKMKSLYAVDRLTLWNKNSKYVSKEKGSAYIVKLPRRSSTVLLSLSGPSIGDFHTGRIAIGDLKLHKVPGDAKSISGEVKSGTAVQELENKIVVDRSDKTPRALTWTRVKYAGGSGWVKGDESLRPPRVVAVREFLGISVSFFGLFAHQGTPVRWRNRDYIAFQNMKSGASYTLEFDDGFHNFGSSKSPKVKGISWKDYYVPVELAAVKVK